MTARVTRSEDLEPDVDTVPDAARSAAGIGYLTWWTWASVALGSALRFRNWAHDRSLWLDEIAITRNLETRGMAGLLKPLGTSQAAPVGWLWAERLMINIFGVSEYVLRLVPLLTSLVALIAFPLLARLTVDRRAVPFATLIFACAPALVYYASETKQYSSDVMCVVLILLVTAVLLRRPLTLSSALLWGLVCSALSWFSFPAIFVALMCGLVLAIRWCRSIKQTLELAAAAAILAANVWWQYVVTIRDLSHNEALDSYWQIIGGYPPRPATASSDLRWLRRSGLGVLSNPVHLTLLWLAVAVIAWGIVVTARRRAKTAALLWVPIIPAVALALTHHYPLNGRLALYLLPGVVLLMAAGAIGLVAPIESALSEHSRVRLLPVAATFGVAALVLGLTAGQATVTGLGKLIHPDDVTSAREAIQFIAHNRQPEDLLLRETPWSVSSLAYYGPRYNLRPNGSFRMTASSRCGVDPIRALRTHHRVWVLLTHRPSNEPVDRNEIYLSQFATGATLLMAYSGAGQTAAYLLDYSKPPVNPPTPLKPWIRGGCLSVNVR